VSTRIDRLRPQAWWREVTRSILTTGIAVLATVGIAALLPSAVAAWSTSDDVALSPVSVRIEGTLSTIGLEEAPTRSLLVLHNDGDHAIRFTVDPSVAVRHPAVRIEVWAAQGGSCGVRGVLLQPGRWSSATLAPQAGLPLCVEVTDGRADPDAPPAGPALAVHARNA
jgi:hypothetical protein